MALPHITPADVYAAREELARRKLGRGIPVLDGLRETSRYKGAWGGRGSGKSHTMAELVVLAMLTDPAASVVCIREIQKSLALSAKKLIEAKIEQWQLGHLFEVQAAVIKRIGGKGICIFQGMQDHTADSIKSLEGFQIAWVEEAQSLSQRSMDLLRPTIRAPGSELWFSWNPRRRSDPVEKLLRPRSRKRNDAIVLRANYTDNPHLPAELLAEAEDSRLNEPDQYGHIWLGDYESAGSKIVIPPAHVEAAIGLAQHLGIEVTGKKFSALDVAGAEEGGDENAQSFRHGIEVQRVDTWNGLDTAITTQRAARNAHAYGADDLQYDSVGVGEGVTGEWASMGRRNERPDGLEMVPWNGGAAVLNPDDRTEPSNPRSPLNKDQYHNLKAQAWFWAAKLFRNAFAARNGRPYDPELIVSLSPEIANLAQLQDELSQPQQKPSATGKTMVDKQPDNAKSPNMADCVVMGLFPIQRGGYDWNAFL